MLLGLGLAVGGWFWGQVMGCSLHLQGWSCSCVQLFPGEHLGSSLLLLVWLWRHSQRYVLLTKATPGARSIF